MSAGIHDDRGQLDMEAVPAHIRRNAERANRALAAQREGRDPMAALAGQEQPQEAQEQPQEAQERQEAPKPQEAPREAQEPPQEAPREAPREAKKEPSREDQTWEQRFRSLEGQVQQINQQKRDLEGENQQLRTALRDMEGRMMELATQAPAPVAGAGNDEPGQKLDIASLFTEEERAEYGPELFNMFGRVADALHGEVEKVRGQTLTLSQRNQMSDRQRMHTELDAQVPDWQRINNEPDFKEFLMHMDEGSGQLRRALLQNAYNSNQTNRVLYFFKRFLNETGRAAPEAQQGQASEGRAAAPRSKSLSDIAAPGKAKQGQAPLPSAEPAGPKRYKINDVQKFSQLKALGKLSMTPEEIRAQSAEFDRAYSEGRIDF